MVLIEIIGIRKDNGNHHNPYEAVEAYQWKQHSTGRTDITSRDTVVRWLSDGIGGESVQAYVHRVDPVAYCYINTSQRGKRFLQTRADATEENNLLNLPPC
jgi:hypothetical protein